MSVGPGFGPNGAKAANQWEQFFGKPLRPLDNVDPYETENADLPDAYVGQNRHLSTVLIRSITAADAYLVTEVLPWTRRENSDNIEWSTVTFNDHLLDRRSEESVSRLLSFERSSERAAFTSFGIAMLMESGFYKTAEGKMFYTQNLKQISNATIETACLGAALELLNAPRAPNSFADENDTGLTVRQFLQIVRQEVAMFGIVQSTENGFEIGMNKLREILSIQGVKANYTIVPEGMKLYMEHRPENSMALYSGKPGMHPDAELARLDTVRVSRPFAIGQHNPSIDPFVQDRTIGTYYQMSALTTASIPPEDYRTEQRCVHAWSEDADDWRAHKLALAFKASGLYTDEGVLSNRIGRGFFSLDGGGQHGSMKSYLDAFSYTDRVVDGIKRFNTRHGAGAGLAFGLGQAQGQAPGPGDQSDDDDIDMSESGSAADASAGMSLGSAMGQEQKGASRMTTRSSATPNAEIGIDEKGDVVNTAGMSKSAKKRLRQKRHRGGTGSNGRFDLPNGRDYGVHISEYLRNLTSTDEIINMLQHPDSLDLNNIFLFLLEADVHFPLSFLLMAPHIRFKCGSVLMCKAGRELGATYFGFPDFQLGRDANQKMIFGHFTLKLKSVVVNRKMLTIGRDMFIKKYLGGGGHVYWQVSDNHQGEYQSGQLEGHDLFVVAVPPDFDPVTNIMDITGKFDTRIVYDDQPILHYPSANIYKDYWGWVHGREPSNRKYEEVVHARFNTIVIEGAQCNFRHEGNGRGRWNDFTVNKGHISDRVYPGCGKVRNGNAARLLPVNYNNTAALAVIV